MRLYIAGPMSGIPHFNIPAFDAMAAKLRALGHEVVSPAELDGPETRAAIYASKTGSHRDLPPGETWGFYLSRDVRLLADDGIEGVVVLPGWGKSKGARLETFVACALLDKPVYLLSGKQLLRHPVQGLVSWWLGDMAEDSGYYVSASRVKHD